MVFAVLQLRPRTSRPAKRSVRPWRIGGLAAAIAAVFRPETPRITPEDLQKHDSPMCTQRVGVRFREHMRDVFRLRGPEKRF